MRFLSIFDPFRGSSACSTGLATESPWACSWMWSIRHVCPSITGGAPIARPLGLEMKKRRRRHEKLDETRGFSCVSMCFEWLQIAQAHDLAVDRTVALTRLFLAAWTQKDMAHHLIRSKHTNKIYKTYMVYMICHNVYIDIGRTCRDVMAGLSDFVLER